MPILETDDGQFELAKSNGKIRTTPAGNPIRHSNAKLLEAIEKQNNYKVQNLTLFSILCTEIDFCQDSDNFAESHPSYHRFFNSEYYDLEVRTILNAHKDSGVQPTLTVRAITDDLQSDHCPVIEEKDNATRILNIIHQDWQKMEPAKRSVAQNLRSQTAFYLGSYAFAIGELNIDVFKKAVKFRNGTFGNDAESECIAINTCDEYLKLAH